MSDNIFEKMTEEERKLAWMLMIFNKEIGYWIVKDSKQLGYDIGGVKTWYMQIMCSKCGFIKTAIEGRIGKYKFCPNCGQPKMEYVLGSDMIEEGEKVEK